MTPMHRQRGISIFLALFVLVVLAALGAYMLTIGGVQQLTGTLSAQGSRAVFAAQSGMEWAIYDAVHNNGASLSCGSPPHPAFVLSGGAASGFQVQVVDCTRATVDEGGTSYNVYRITVRASKGSPNALGYASRTIRATITGP